MAYKNYLYSGYGSGFGYLVENLVYILYLQSAYMLSDEATVEREYSSLEAIGDNFEKIVVSMDDLTMPLRGGIKHIQLWRLNDIFLS